MFTIKKRFDFCASHQLKGLPEGHQCGRLHGHNYQVELELQSIDLDGHGFVRDYGELDSFKKYLDENFEHRHLNDLFVQPTAENIAYALFTWAAERFPELIAVSVSETPKTWARFENKPGTKHL